MNFFRRMSPFAALRDLRLFLSHRSPYELVFGMISVVLTSLVLMAFVIDSRFEKPYQRNIQYFDNWPSNRTDAEIVAKQKVDEAARQKAQADWDAARAKRQAEFKRLNDRLESMGL